MRDGFMSDFGNVNGIRVQDLAKVEGSKTAQCMSCQIATSIVYVFVCCRPKWPGENTEWHV